MQAACARARGDWRSSLGCDAPSGPPFRPARENDSLCLANLVGHWWFGSQRHARPGSPMSSKVDMINALGQAEVARKKAQRSAYVPDLFLLERLNFFTQIPKQCPQSQACFGSFLAQQLDSGVSSLGAKLPKLEEYWLKAAATLELEKGLTAAPLYFTRILRDVLPLLGPDLRAQVEAFRAYRYAAQADPSSAAAVLPPLLSSAVLRSLDGGTLADSHSPAGSDSRSAGGTGLLRRHAVVHYRVGDMLSLHVNGGMIINPAAVAAAAASFAPAPTSVEILDGGVGWGVDGAVNSDDDPSSVISRSLGVRLMASDCIPHLALARDALQSECH